MSSPTSRNGPVAMQPRPIDSSSIPSRPLPPPPKQSLNSQARQLPVVAVAAKADTVMHSAPRNNASITPVSSKPAASVTSPVNVTPMVAKAAAVVKPVASNASPTPTVRTVATPEGPKTLVVMTEAEALKAQNAVLAYIADVKDLERSKTREAQYLKEATGHGRLAEEAKQKAQAAQKIIEQQDEKISIAKAEIKQLEVEEQKLDVLKQQNDKRKEGIKVLQAETNALKEDLKQVELQQKAIVAKLGPEGIKRAQECLKTSISKVVGCDPSKIQIPSFQYVPFDGHLISDLDNNKLIFIIDPHGMERLIQYFSLCEPRAASKVKELNFTSIGKDIPIPDIDKLAEGLKKHPEIKKISLFCPLTVEEARHLASAHLKTGIVIACGNETAKQNVKQAVESLKTAAVK